MVLSKHQHRRSVRSMSNITVCPKHKRQLNNNGECRDCGCKPDIKAMEQREKLEQITTHIFQICDLLEQTGRTMQSGTLDNGWSYKFKQRTKKGKRS